MNRDRMKAPTQPNPKTGVESEEPAQAEPRTDGRAESSLRGHLKAEGQEESGSPSYVPPDAKNDKALNMALDLMRGVQRSSMFPPRPPARRTVK